MPDSANDDPSSYGTKRVMIDVRSLWQWLGEMVQALLVALGPRGVEER